MTTEEKALAIENVCDTSYACMDCPLSDLRYDILGFCYSRSKGISDAEYSTMIDFNYNVMFPSAPNEAEAKDTNVPNKVQLHLDLVTDLNDLYRRKNADYGDSFHKSYLEEGMAMPRIRLSDKLERFKSLTRNGKQEVKDESIRDTLLDLANYAIMTVLELDGEE